MPYADPEKQREAQRKSVAKRRAEKKAAGVHEGNPDVRARAWTFIVYPESAPENWRDVLDGFHLQWACSPLHDRDVNATGEPKKAHWHILLSFGGKRATGKSGAFQRLLTAHVRRSAKTKRRLFGISAIGIIQRRRSTRRATSKLGAVLT